MRMELEELSDELLILEADPRFSELDELVKGVMEDVAKGSMDPHNGYVKILERSRDIFPLIATDLVIGKKLLVDRVHTLMLLSILERLGKLERGTN